METGLAMRPLKTFYCSDYPNDQEAMNAAMDWAIEHDEGALLVARHITRPEDEPKDE